MAKLVTVTFTDIQFFETYRTERLILLSLSHNNKKCGYNDIKNVYLNDNFLMFKKKVCKTIVGNLKPLIAFYSISHMIVFKN